MYTRHCTRPSYPNLTCPPNPNLWEATRTVASLIPSSSWPSCPYVDSFPPKCGLNPKFTFREKIQPKLSMSIPRPSYQKHHHFHLGHSPWPLWSCSLWEGQLPYHRRPHGDSHVVGDRECQQLSKHGNGCPPGEPSDEAIAPANMITSSREHLVNHTRFLTTEGEIVECLLFKLLRFVQQ